MPSILVKIIWDDVAKASKQFSQQQSEIAKVNRKLKAAKDDLHSGKGWVGKGATKFFQEFDQDIMPSMTRLEKALGSAERVAKQVEKTMKDAESQWTNIFKMKF
jgi:WXG100 family type VII secretion target